MMRTLQQIFSLAYAGLQLQGWKQAGEKLKGEEFICTYLSSEDDKCAIGHCIPDIDKYKNEAWFNSNVRAVPEGILDTSATLHCLIELQLCHDESYTPQCMQQAFNQFANEYNLEVPPNGNN